MNENQNINQLPKGWERKQFSEVAKLLRGVSYDKQFAFNNPNKGLIPLIRATNIQNGLVLEEFVYVPEKIVKEEQLIKEGDILLAMSSGSKELVGKSAQAKQDYKIGFGTFCGLIRANDKINKKYFGFFFQTRNYRNYVSKVSKGIGINNLRRNHIEDLIFPIPSILEQATIVSKIEELFSEVDKGIEEIKTAQQQLKVYRQAVLKSAFEGKLTNKDVREGELPAGWTLKNLGSVAKLINGDRGKNYPNRNEYVDEGIAFINTGHIEPNGKLSLETMHYLKREKFNSLNSGKVRNGDLVYCLRGATLGKTAIIEQFEEGAIASSLVIIRLNKEISNRFVYYFLTGPLGRDCIFKFDNGSAQPNLSAKSVTLYKIPLPDFEEQQQVVQEIESRLSVCDKIEETITNSLKQAEALRQSILKKAFEGKLVE